MATAHSHTLKTLDWHFDMEEETKKRGRGRPPKKTSQWGGKREGAGRKKGVKTGPRKENPKDTMLPFRVSALTAGRIKQLRELTKQDEKPFVDMLEEWVAEYAKDYGIE